MLTSGNMLKSLVAVLVLAVLPSTEADEKQSSCCTTVSRKEFPESITGYWVQQWSAPCVQAVIFQTEKGLMCSHLNAPWVRRKIVEFRRARLSTRSPSRTSSPPPSPPSPSPSLLSLLYPSSATPSRTSSLSFSTSSSTDSTMEASTSAQ